MCLNIHIISCDAHIALACNNTNLNIYISVLHSIETTDFHLLISKCTSNHIGVSIKNGYVTPFHFGIFIYHNHSPAAIETCGATCAFNKSHIRNKVFTNAMLLYIVSYFGISGVHLTISSSRIVNIA